MAKDKFDFEALQALNKAKYLKEYCKPVQVKKATGAIILADYKLKGKKESIVFLPFKKLKEAEILFKQIKADKSHVLKKVAFAIVNVDTKTNEIAFTVKKGGLDADTIAAKGATFFESNFKLSIKAAKAEEMVADKGEEKKEDSEASTGTADSAAATDAPKKKLTPEKREKLVQNMTSIEGELDKIAKALKLNA